MSIDRVSRTSRAQALDAQVGLPHLSVMVVEDEAAVARTFCLFMENSGIGTLWASNGQEAMRGKQSFRPQVVLVDMALPDTNGIDLIRWLLQCGDCGIIVVSGASDEAERVVAIELGADDYISKPPALREMVARIRAVHRRVGERNRSAPSSLGLDTTTPPQVGNSKIILGDVEVDLSRREINGRDGVNPLTDAEYRALALLLNAEGSPVSRERLCEAALNRKLGFEDRSVDQLILKVRRKLGADGGASRLISSVRGAGYALQP